MLLSKSYLMGWVIMAIINTFMALNEVKLNRMLMLVAVVVLQHITLLLFMVDYEKMGSAQWKEREKRLTEEIKEKLRAEVRPEMKEKLKEE